MTDIPFIPFAEGEAALDWLDLTDAIAAGHMLPKAEIGDTFLYRRDDTLLSRAAWIDGMGIAVKSATIFPGNAAVAKPNVNGGVNLYTDDDGMLEAIVDFHLVTKWKTAGDSLLAARRLARADSRNILLVGAGAVARSLYAAYAAAFPAATFTLWNRTRATAEAMAEELNGVTIADDLEAAVAAADIIGSATMSTEPLIRGAWLRPGQHIDLKRARLFVDSFDTTVGHIGEIDIPLKSGVISRSDIIADFYDLDAFQRHSDDEITICKNGGGAHLDLMTSRYILARWTCRA